MTLLKPTSRLLDRLCWYLVDGNGDAILELKMSALTSGHLTSQVLSVLSGPALRMNNFQVGNVFINTMGYGMVAALIQQGRIKCALDPSVIHSGAAAIYNITTNTISTLNDSMFYLDEMAGIVHEATHAMIDAFNGLGGYTSSVRVLDNETAAYLAQEIYTLVFEADHPSQGAKMIVYSTSKTIANVARRTAQGKIGKMQPVGTTNGGSPIVFALADVAALNTIIKSSPNYKDWSVVEHTDGVP